MRLDLRSILPAARTAVAGLIVLALSPWMLAADEAHDFEGDDA